MSFTSFSFGLLVAACVLLYYAVPLRHRWLVLLAASWLYYAAAGPSLMIFLLFSTVTTFLGASWAEKGSRAGIAVPLILDFGMLAVLKYSNFAILIANRIPGVSIPMLKLLLPLGISFYTFQSAGYLLDVYWKGAKRRRTFSDMHCSFHFFRS